MKSLVDDLDAAVGEIEPDFSVADVHVRAQRRRTVGRRRRAALGVAGVIAVLVGAFVVTNTWERDAAGPPADAPAPPVAGQGAFSQPTGTALVFDDGYDGVATVDLDTRRVVRRPIDGQGAGDASFRLIRVESSFVVGGPMVYAASMDGGRSRKIGEATIALPATEPGRVWLVTYASGRTDTGPYTLRQVDLSGRVRIAERPGPSGVPVAGIPGGVAIQTADGLALWAGSSGQVTGRLGTGNVVVSDVAGDKIAWCDGDCRELHVTRIGGDDLLLPGDNPLRHYVAGAARFDPEGRLLAVLTNFDVSRPAGTRAPSQLWLADTSGTYRNRQTLFSHYVGDGETFSGWVDVVWSEDAKRVFAVEQRPGETTVSLTMYTLAERVRERATIPIPIPLQLTAVGLDRAGAADLLDAPIVPADACRAPSIQPSGRTDACAFVF